VTNQMSDVDSLPRVDLRDPRFDQQMMSALADWGIALFQGATGREDFIRKARSLVTVRPHRDSDPDGVTTIARRSPTNEPSMTGFTERELLPHTEGSAVLRPPRVLMLCCATPAESGGEILLVDGRALHRAITLTEPAMLAELSAPRSAYFGGRSGHVGAIFTETPPRRIVLRLRLDDLLQLSPTADPFRTRLCALVMSHALAVDLRPGEGYVLLNDQWLHGRTGFGGDRHMIRIIGEPLPGAHLPPGFPSHTSGADPHGSTSHIPSAGFSPREVAYGDGRLSFSAATT
jgi:hypothetical protein